jgi:signal transduction histidine kinase/CheY-like chemotaxis protein
MLLALFSQGFLRGSEASPRVFPIRNLPSNVHEYRDAATSPSGWVFGAADGVVFQRDTWQAWSASHGSDLQAVAPLGSGATVVTGTDFCSILEPDGREKPLLKSGTFQSAATDGVTAVVASTSVAHAITEDGIVASMKLTEGTLPPRVNLVGRKLVLFAPYDGVFEYSAGTFHKANAFEWAMGKLVILTAAENSSDYFALTNRGFFEIRSGEAQSVFPALAESLSRRAMDGVMTFGEQLVVSSYYDGLSGYAQSDERKLWGLPPSDFGGNVYFIRAVKDGLLVGSSTGLFVVPDPSRFLYWRTPVGDLNSLASDQEGPLLAIGDKVYRLDGTALQVPDGTLSVLPYKGGYVVGTFGGRLILPGGRILQTSGADAPKFAALSNGFGVINGRRLYIFKDDKFAEHPNVGVVDSIASVDDRLMIGTSQGAVVLDADGRVDRRFGSGPTVVMPLGSQGAVAFDSQGSLFDFTGFRVAAPPFKQLLGAVRWNGSTVLIGRLADGTAAIMSLAPSGALAPLDLPVESPVSLAVHDGNLCVISSGYVLEAKSAPPVEMPPQEPTLNGLAAGATLALPANGGAVTLSVPPARIGPWLSPTYEYKVGSGGWEPVLAGAKLAIDRLAPGESAVEVHAKLVGLDRTTSFRVERAFPFWLTWPAFALYAVASAALVWGLVKWRVKHLALEARRLQGIVDERTSELKKAQAVREEFFSTLSHEIRNPLNGVVGLCDILSEAPPGSIGPREKRIVGTLRGCAGQLRGMLDDVLDFSRIDRGEIQLSIETFDLVSAIEGSVRSVDVGLTNSELVIPHDPVWVSGDCGKLRQIITNLASNGLKYGIPQKIRITLASKVNREGSLDVQISVSNTGNTIPEKDLISIFKGFSRGDDAIRRRIPGHGLGLAVSRRMAHSMGGTLTAQSHEGLTVFSLAIALAISDAPVTVAPTTHKPKLSKALAIEDESYNRMVLGHILSQLGYSVDWAVDGASAMERIRSETYDLVLTDYLLPDTTGAELANRILSEAPEPKPPVIAVTAYSTHEKVSELLKAGVAQIVSKPVSLEKMRTAIMGLSAPSGRRSLDLAPQRASCNFGPILATAAGAEALAGYSEDLQMAWSWTQEALEGDLEEAAKAVHEFRSKVLVVEAMEAANLMGRLEAAVRFAEMADVRRIKTLLDPMIEAIASSAKAEAKRAQSRGPGVP